MSSNASKGARQPTAAGGPAAGDGASGAPAQAAAGAAHGEAAPADPGPAGTAQAGTAAGGTAAGGTAAGGTAAGGTAAGGTAAGGAGAVADAPAGEGIAGGAGAGTAAQGTGGTSTAGTAAQGAGGTGTAAQGTAGTAAQGAGGTGTAAQGAGGTAGAGGLAAGLAGAGAGAATIVLDPEPEHEPGEDDLPAEPVSKLAVLALVTGVIALVPVAVISGIAALTGIRRCGRRGRGMALAGLLASAAWIIVTGAIGTVGVLTHGFQKPATIKYHEAAVFKLQEGQCVDSPDGQLVSVLPCSAPHEAEVFATFSLPASAWPGTTAIATQASSGCAGRLTGYLNPQLAVSLSQLYVYPNKAAWTQGTRTVICEVRAATGQLTGSVRAAG